MDLIEALRSIGEPTRLRVLALLAHGELAVGELVDILAMSQPRLQASTGPRRGYGNDR